MSITSPSKPLRDAAAAGGGTAGRGGRGDPGFRPEDALVGRHHPSFVVTAGTDREAAGAGAAARLDLVRYHGVLAPHAADRSRIVPGPATRADEAEDGSGHARPASGRDRLSWAKLLARVFRIDVSVCPDCGGRMRVIAALTEPGSIRRCLAGMGLSGRARTLS
mgnify:CR=1 FL=1